MRQPKLIDYILLTILALIWASAFFNIKIATYSLWTSNNCFSKSFFWSNSSFASYVIIRILKLKLSPKDWHWFAMIGFINLVAPFFLISIWS